MKKQPQSPRSLGALGIRLTTILAFACPSFALALCLEPTTADRLWSFWSHILYLVSFALFVGSIAFLIIAFLINKLARGKYAVSKSISLWFLVAGILTFLPANLIDRSHPTFP